MICAIVVTYNRKELLVNCLGALMRQTRPIDALYLIDNASTDGTPSVLLEHGFIDQLPPSGLTDPYEMPMNRTSLGFKGLYIRMNMNTGGAGGFYEGVKRGHKDGCSWLWLMDDDGIPDKDCLKELLSKKGDADFIAPLVVNMEDKRELSFGLEDIVHKLPIKTVNKAKQSACDGILKGTANPFNGVLLSKKLVSSIGYPKPEMFIYGDESEYLLRTIKNGFSVITMVNAIHLHPKVREETKLIFFNKFRVGHRSNRLKNYCSIRNRSYILWNYNKASFIVSILKYLWFFVVSRRFDVSSLLFYLTATFDGVVPTWGKERKYL